MNSKTDLERGMERVRDVRRRGFGEVYVAKDRMSNDLVAIKKVKVMTDSDTLENESRMLKDCVSKFIVRYCDVVRKEGEVWVCDGVKG